MSKHIAEDNYLALYIAIIGECSPEIAFHRLKYGYSAPRLLTESDVLDMIKLKEAGLTFQNIGDIYNLHPTTIQKRLKRYTKQHNIKLKTKKNKLLFKKGGCTKCQ